MYLEAVQISQPPKIEDTNVDVAPDVKPDATPDGCVSSITC